MMGRKREIKKTAWNALAAFDGLNLCTSSLNQLYDADSSYFRLL